MVALLCFLLTLLASPFKSKPRLEAENAVLRHQLIVLQRQVRGRVQFTIRSLKKWDVSRTRCRCIKACIVQLAVCSVHITHNV